MDININAGHPMNALELAYAHPVPTFFFALLGLALIGVLFDGVCKLISAFRGNYNAGPIDETT